MTITVKINGGFHQFACPGMESNQIDSKCKTQLVTLSYRCSECVRQCLKCEAARLNTNLPFVRGCKEARQVKSRVFSCACSEICES